MDSIVRTYYRQQHPSFGRAVTLANEVIRQDLRRLRNRSNRLMLVAVSCSLLAAASLGIHLFQVDRKPEGSAFVTELASQSPDRSSWQTRPDEKLADLVAVKYQIDWCALSKKTEPVFAELLLRYGNEPVQFTVFKMSNKKELEHSREMAERLGIHWLPSNPNQSGKIYLVRPAEQKVLAVLSNPDEKQSWEGALQNALQN